MGHYVGKTSYNGVSIDFELEDFTLKLYVSGDIATDIMYYKKDDGMYIGGQKKPLNVNILRCYTNDEEYQIDCYFQPDSYGANSRNMYVGQSTIIIPITRYIIYDRYKIDKNNKFYMIYYSKQIHRFTNLVPNFQFDNKTDSPSYYFKCDFPSTKLIAKEKVGDYEIKIAPTWVCKWNGPKIDFTPGLKIEFDKAIGEEDIEKFYNTFLYFIQYCFMRTDIFPERLEFCNGNMCGTIFSRHDGVDEEEDLISVYRDSFSWKLLQSHAGTLFKLIYDKSIHILNTQEKKSLRIYVSLESISKDSAAFEYEFDSLFPSGVPYSDERKQMEKEIIEELTPLMEKTSGKKRKTYKGFISHVHIESLADKIEYAFETYKTSIQTVKSRLKIGYSSEQLGEYCSKIRNNVDHGNKIETITDEEVNSFILLRCLIYAMQLTKAGYKDEEIDTLVNLLYLLKGLPV